MSEDFGDGVELRDDVGGKTGWSAAGKLTQGDVNRKVSLQAAFSKAGEYTIQFGIKFPPEREDEVGPPAVQGSTPTRCNALITWSVEGNSISRVVTVTNGLQVTGTGQAVEVEIYDNSQEENGIPVAGDDYTAWVLVAPGSRAEKGQPPTLLSEFTNPTAGVRGLVLLEGGTTVDVPIPQDAGVISFYQTYRIMSETVAGGPYPIIVQQIYKGASPATVLEYHDLKGGLNGEWVPLAPGANYIRLVFNDPDPLKTAYVSTIFGIDG